MHHRSICYVSIEALKYEDTPNATPEFTTDETSHASGPFHDSMGSNSVAMRLVVARRPVWSSKSTSGQPVLVSSVADLESGSTV